MKSIYAIFMVCHLLCPLMLWAQSRTITGKVSAAESGTPLPGVTIQVKGTNEGTTTDAQGNYRITVQQADAQLIFRFIGYLAVEMPVAGQAVLNVPLKSDTRNLEQVVVTALGIVRKERSVGYATQQVKGENLTLTKEQNVIGSLSGKIAGVQVTGSSGASMGGTQKIKIRGANSISGADQPLIVIDGTPVSNSNFSAERNGPDLGNLAQDINPDDIAAISVLKGPAASALYGLRGQFGVVMITTKKGARKGDKKVSVDFSSAFSLEKAGNFMPLQNVYGGGGSQTFSTINVNGVQQPFVSGTDESWGPKMDGRPVRHMYSWFPADPDYGKLTPFSPHPNNIKDFYRTGSTFNNNISVSGGGENSSFRLSYNHTRVEGVEPNTWLRRNNLGFNGSLNITPSLQVSTSLNYANNNAQRPSQGYYEGSRNFVQWFQRSLDMNKLRQYKYDDGRFYHWNLSDPTQPGFLASVSDWNNPYFEAYENPAHDSRDRFFGNVGLTYDPLPGLKLSGFIRGDMYVQQLDKREAAGGRRLNSYSTGKYQNKEMNYEFLAQYNREWGDVSLNANLGANLLTQRYSYLSAATQGGLSVPNFFNISASKERPVITDYLRRKEIYSYFGSATVGYKDIYYLDATLRNDRSSTLPKDNNSYWYASGAASIVFSELLQWKPLSFGKLRVSLAQAGSDLDAYRISQTYNLRAPIGNTYPMSVPDTLNNPDIKPAIGTSFETGVELRFLNNRLGLDVTYYNQQNKDQVIRLDVSGTSGFSYYWVNAGNIQNKGIEISLNAQPVKSRLLNWTTVFNISRNTSLIKSLYPGINNLILDQNTYSRVSVFLNATVNGNFGTLVGNAYQRDPKTGKILLDAQNLPMFEQNHDFGSVLPRFTGGWQNTFRIGNFDIGAMIDFQSGGRFFSWSRMLAVKSGQAAETAAMNDRGKNVRDPVAEGGGVKVNGISAATGQEVTAYVDAKAYFRSRLGTSVYEEWLYDASYIKMRELRAGYTFRKEQFKGLPFSSLNIAFIARNPFMIYQKAPKGLDPSELSAGSAPISWLETGQLITTRSFGLNLNVSF